jgi:hypothetical protein
VAIGSGRALATAAAAHGGSGARACERKQCTDVRALGSLLVAWALVGCGAGVRRDPLAVGPGSPDANPVDDAAVPVDQAPPAPDLAIAPVDGAPDAPPDLSVVTVDASPVAAVDAAVDLAAPIDGCGEACPRAHGADCERDDQCVSRHCVDGRCCQSAACTGDCNFCRGPAGTCVEQTAAPAEVPGCLDRFACTPQKACRKLVGAPCTGGDQCESGSCVQGSCACTLCLSPALLDQGTTADGQITSIRMVVQNSTAIQQEPFEIALVPPDDPTVWVDRGDQPFCGSAPVAPADGCQFWVELKLTAGMSEARTVELRRGGAVIDRAYVGATGVPNDTPTIEGADMGELPLGSNMRPWSLSLTNTRPQSFVIDRVYVAGRDAADFHLISNLCSPSAPAHDRCEVTVQFAPRARGPRSAIIVVEGEGARVVGGLTGRGL